MLITARTSRSALVLLAAGILWGCPSKPSDSGSAPSATGPGVSTTVAHTAYRTKSVDDGRAIEVRVTYTGTKHPASWDIPAMVRSQCGGAEHVPNEALATGDGGGVDGAVVWLDDIREGAPLPEEPATQDEQHCLFTPHVLAVPARGTLTLKNSDPANHAVRFEFPGSDETDDFTRTLPAGATYGVQIKPDWAGHYARVTCPIHLWMWSWVHFFDHPYFAVTRAGVARLVNVPPGHYHLSVWHEGTDTTYASSLKLGVPVTARVEVAVDKDDVKVALTVGDDGKIAAR